MTLRRRLQGPHAKPRSIHRHGSSPGCAGGAAY